MAAITNTTVISICFLVRIITRDRITEITRSLFFFSVQYERIYFVKSIIRGIQILSVSIQVLYMEPLFATNLQRSETEMQMIRNRISNMDFSFALFVAKSIRLQVHSPASRHCPMAAASRYVSPVLPKISLKKARYKGYKGSLLMDISMYPGESTQITAPSIMAKAT